MAKAKSIIAPFPATIDQKDFGNYLSGLVDGEGSFCLSWHPKQDTGLVAFVLQLRSDDRSILELIQSFWGCGRLRDLKPNSSVRNARPTSRFHIVSGEILVGS